MERWGIEDSRQSMADSAGLESSSELHPSYWHRMATLFESRCIPIMIPQNEFFS